MKKYMGDGTWGWGCFIDGPDLVIQHASATAFGGDSDPMDNGTTASGFNTKGRPGLVACSLPMQNDTLKDKVHGYVLRGSPVPRMPFGLNPDGLGNKDGARVNVTFLSTGKTISLIPVIDIGPAKWAGDQIDLTVGLAKLHFAKASSNNFQATVEVRILDACRYLPKDWELHCVEEEPITPLIPRPS